ncbi:MAG: ABC transporter permease [Candidatus Woesearchaeota archaeon]
MRDLLVYVLKNIGKRITRSSLTILSILIGIMSIYALLSFGQGLQKYINDFAKEMGTDKLIIQMKGFGPPGTMPGYLTKEDVEFVHRIQGVDEVVGISMGQAEIRTEENKPGEFVFVSGIDTGETHELLKETFNLKIEAGRDLHTGDNGKVVLGHNYQVPNKIFERPVELGQRVFINGKVFKVIGFYKEIGNPQDDANIYITQEDVEELLNSKDRYSYIMVRTSIGEDPSRLADDIQYRLRRFKGQKEGQEDFFVQTFEQALETFTTIVNVLNAILVIIALISVVVAAVNIMNTMYTAVLERTREIGVMKAIGAENKTILSIFVLESGVLGLTGGVLGVIAGYAVASAGGLIAASAGYSLLKPYFPWWLTAGCLIFAFIVGLASGFFPARAASRLNPVDALRYE